MFTGRLPALGALRAFEAAARHGSFKAAAAELHVTSSAVSQRIRMLEEDLGVSLFVRSPRSVALTSDAKSLQPRLEAAFSEIQTAVDSVRQTTARPLRIAASGPVIRKWLLPRLHRFSERYQELDVSLTAESHYRTPEADEVFIRFKEEPGQGVFSQLLCEEHLLPLASPELIDRLGLKRPEDIVRAPLLHHHPDPELGPAPGWADWFDKVGMNSASASRGTHFDPGAADHAIDAAVNGAGVVLGRRFLARTDVTDNRLVCPFGPSLPMGVNYYVVCAEGAESTANIAAFINWIREETAALAASAP